MLGKVLKYDLKWMAKYLIPLYIIILAGSFVIRALDLLQNQFDFIAVFYGIMSVIFVMTLIVGFVYMAFMNIKRYLDNLFKDEGYLTHTLPVKKGTLLLSKLLTVTITFISTIVVFMLSIFIAYYVPVLLDAFHNLIDYISTNNLGMFFIAILLVLILEYFFYMFLIFASISIGYSKNGNKNINSLIYAIILYVLVQIVNFIFLFIFFLLNVGNYEEIGEQIELINTFMFSMAGLELIYVGILYYISYRWMNKKLNLQ